MPLKRWLYAIAPPQFLPLEEANVLSAMAIAITIARLQLVRPAPVILNSPWLALVGVNQHRWPLRKPPVLNRSYAIRVWYPSLRGEFCTITLSRHKKFVTLPLGRRTRPGLKLKWHHLANT